MKLNSNDITNQKLVAWHGRVYQDKQKTHFFYTGSGFSLRLKGSKLSATFDVDYISESEKPYIKVIVKDSIKEKEFIYGLDKGIHTIVLFEGALNDYDVEIKKRSESMKSRTALIDFESDGNFKELNQKQIKRTQSNARYTSNTDRNVEQYFHRDTQCLKGNIVFLDWVYLLSYFHLHILLFTLKSFDHLSE